MASKYTIFSEGIISKDYKVYEGILDTEYEGLSTIFHAKQHYDRSTELYGFIDEKSNHSTLLKSNYINWRKSNSLMEGFYSSFPIERSGHFTKKSWTFKDSLDHHRSYTWEIKILERSNWYLKDDQGLIAAHVNYTKWTRHKIGTLTIYGDILPHLRACIVLSTILVHQSIKRDAARAGAGSG